MPSLLERLGVELPVVQAGMGGGLSRPRAGGGGGRRRRHLLGEAATADPWRLAAPVRLGRGGVQRTNAGRFFAVPPRIGRSIAFSLPGRGTRRRPCSCG